MQILILGGTAFLGRHLVHAAREAGHSVTLFNRGRSNPGLFPDLETLIGDRLSDLSALEGKEFDAVIDTSGYFPSAVRASAQALSGAGTYTFISTLSVYADNSKPSTEGSPVGTIDNPDTDQITGDSYGPLKALCEDAVRDVFGERALCLRPGLIVGPYDPTNRYTYWPRRLHDGGRVLAPGPPTRPVQFVDARDLAEWAVAMTARGAGGTFNVTSPPIPIGDVLDACPRPDGTELVWVEDDFLVAHDVMPWMELPLWLPDEPDSAGFFATDITRALENGLTMRPLEDTARATLEWDLTHEGPRRAGLDREAEAVLLASWDAGPI